MAFEAHIHWLAIVLLRFQGAIKELWFLVVLHTKLYLRTDYHNDTLILDENG